MRFNKQNLTYDRLSSVAACLLAFAVCAKELGAAEWQGYSVYQPQIERAFVIDARNHELRYNHDSSVAWFRDRWFCVWNANTIPAESAPGQLNYMSTSLDGLSWSEPVPLFASSEYSVNPIPCEKGTQWQPNLLVVNNTLWCIWSQNSRDEHHGCYFSVLEEPEGRWNNRLLQWEGSAEPEFDGKRYRIFPTQNPVQIRSGRVVAPVTLMGPTDPEAPPGDSNWHRLEKRNSVIYSDDGGETWHVSRGTWLPGMMWRQWEPTVFEQSDGVLVMFARNNFMDDCEPGGISASEALVHSESHDGGVTWSTHRYVPIETVVSRMQVLRQPGTERYLMLHNDWPAGRFVADRFNLALFVNRGGGVGFTAGVGVSASEVEVAYPQMEIKDDGLMMVYSQGVVYQRSIRAVRMSPLPRGDQLYIYPRSNFRQASSYIFEDGVAKITGGAIIRKQVGAEIDKSCVLLTAEVSPVRDGALFDNRGAQGGFIWGVSQGSCFVHLGVPNENIRASERIRYGSWNKVGVSIDYGRGEVEFTINGVQEKVEFKPGKRVMSGSGLTLFGPNIAASRVPAFEGEVRSMAVDKREFDLKGVASEFEDLVKERVATAVEVVGGEIRVSGQGSAGVELPANRRSRGDVVELRLRFRIDGGEQGTICTIGDARQPVRVEVRGREVVLSAGNFSRLCGVARQGRWQNLVLRSSSNVTWGALDGGSEVSVSHQPEENWFYLGDGYPGQRSAELTYAVDIDSVKSRCVLQRH